MKAKAEPGIWMQDVPEPTIGHNDVLIRMQKTAICGTDMHIYKWDDWARRTIRVPMAVGHEYCGEIVGMGGEVRGFSIGDRVSGEGHLTCGYCRNCRAGRRHLCRNTVGVGVNRPGCFAEYMSLPAVNVCKLPDAIYEEIAATLEPFGNAPHPALFHHPEALMRWHTSPLSRWQAPRVDATVTPPGPPCYAPSSSGK